MTSSDQYDSDGREKIQCGLCLQWYHRLDVHLKNAHKTSVEAYRVKYPDAPTISESARLRASNGQQARRGKKPKQQGAVPEDELPFSANNPLIFGAAQLQMRQGLCPQDQAAVPVFDPHWICGQREKETLENIALGVELNTPVFTFGPTGCGKSSAYEYLASILNQPVLRIQMNQRFTTEEFVGRLDVELDADTGNPITRWLDGPLTNCMRRGWWLILDELTGSPPGIMLKIQAVLEGKPLVLSENGGEVVERHPEFRFLATDNTNGCGDTTGLYAGTNVLNEATLDRFGVVIQARYPVATDEVNILIRRAGVNQNTALAMVKVAERVREAAVREQCFCTFSTRRLALWAILAQKLGDVHRAASITVTSKLNTEDRVFVVGLIQRHFGTGG